jgi:5'-3' exonuclease
VHVHLVDGTYELFRAYYGAPSRKSPDGVEVGATRAFMRSMLTLLEDETVTHIAIAFDHVVESFRNELYDGYKTGDGIEAELAAQFTLVEEGAEALGFVVWPMVEFEADDAIASAAIKFSRSKKVERVWMCSPDKDLAQVVRGDRIVSWDRMREKIFDEAGVREKFGVATTSIPDYLALVGDSADGIPGIPRWGAKSTATVLARYGSLDAIPSDPADWDLVVRGAKTLSSNLEQAREEAELFRRLATLRDDVPIVEKLGDLEWRGAKRETLEPFLERLGDTTMAGRVSAWLGE